MSCHMTYQRSNLKISRDTGSRARPSFIAPSSQLDGSVPSPIIPSKGSIANTGVEFVIRKKVMFLTERSPIEIVSTADWMSIWVLSPITGVTPTPVPKVMVFDSEPFIKVELKEGLKLLWFLQGSPHKIPGISRVELPVSKTTFNDRSSCTAKANSWFTHCKILWRSTDAYSTKPPETLINGDMEDVWSNTHCRSVPLK